MIDALSPQQFTDRFHKCTDSSPVYVNVGGRDPLALKVTPSPDMNCKALVVLFHGALGRSKGAEVPSFLNVRRSIVDSAHQVSIADPGVEVSNRVGVGWFAGSEANPSQQLLPPFFRHLKEALNVDRVIFVGSSGGGFGALFYSWNLPGSIACASVPQTNAWEYNESTRRFYLEDCWPKGLQNYQQPPVLDLRELYSHSVPNTVVYVQSSLDDRHFTRHMIPFLDSISVGDRDKIALKVSYWGRPGHSGAVPPGELDGWIRAAISSPDTTSQSIIQQYQMSGVETTPLSQAMMRNAGATTQSSSAEGTRRGTQEAAFQDIVWTKMITDFQLIEGA